jgi:hypothetical protein
MKILGHQLVTEHVSVDMEMQDVSIDTDSQRERQTFPWMRIRYIRGEGSRKTEVSSRQRSVEDKSINDRNQ